LLLQPGIPHCGIRVNEVVSAIFGRDDKTQAFNFHSFQRSSGQVIFAIVVFNGM
jgi:hypothetical protein